MDDMVLELSGEDHKAYRELLNKAVNIELQLLEMQEYIVKKYLAGENLNEVEWFIDHETGEVYTYV